MKIVWETTVYAGNGPSYCAICTGRFHPLRARGSLSVLAVVYNQRGQACGEACRDCAGASVELLRRLLGERIEKLRSDLQDLEALAAEPIEPPSLEQEFRAHL
ncbi:hypothetical protein [Gloeobacter morelensis]|uniref:Uncharacterized protein n=1 Tax=Gloeobacter morelensis MG652769 TaxID=2781736 RepID=A0ABY3PG76_9CYAN|nr:hypothetical protein [Gloeobacter morelensis]UFP92645.1 hypothetical protein ISF26_12405 [Gloeobacter morelensis MG652769]